MKKVILIIFIFLLTGCYDYKEVNNLAFISTITMDYEDEKFNLTFEILSDSSDEESSFTVSGSGKSISESFDNISLKIAKMPYYYHLKAIVISENVAKNKMKELTDYIVRNTEIRNEFNLFIIKDMQAKDIFSLTDEEDKIMGDKLTKMISSSKYTFDASYNKPFEDILEKLLNNNYDAVCTVIGNDNNKLTILGIGIFNKFTYQKFISKNQASTFDLLTEKSYSMLLESNNISIKLYDSNISYEIDDSNILIKIDTKAIIMQSDGYNLKSPETYKNLTENFNNILNEKVLKLINLLKEDNLDPLGIKNIYYTKGKDIPSDISINVQSNVHINKKGLIFEVTNE